MRTVFYDRAYCVFRAFYRVIFRVLFRCECTGLSNVPASGGAVLAVNHTSALDPPLAGLALDRKIWFVGRSNLVKNRLLDFVFRCQRLIPLKQGAADLAATKRIIDLLKAGEVVLMFPEGTRSPDGSLGPGRAGVGMFVSRARADVIPCFISGARRALPKGAVFPRPRKVRVAYGPLIRFEEFRDIPATREGFTTISVRIMERIAELKRQLD